MTLFTAIQSGDLDAVRQRLAAGENPNAVGTDGTPLLHLAAQMGYAPIAKLLLDHGADLHAIDDSLNDALYYAISAGHTSVVKAFIDAGADVNNRYFGKSAIAIAALNNHDEIVQLLADAGAKAWDVAQRNSFNSPDYRAGRTMGSMIVTEKSLLHNVVESGNANIVRNIIRAGADVNAESLGGHTPLQDAARAGHHEVTKVLINAGAEINKKNTIPGWTALHGAAYEGHLETVIVLIEELRKVGGDTEIKCRYGKVTALDLAKQQGHTACVEALAAAKELHFEELRKRGARFLENLNELGPKAGPSIIVSGDALDRFIPVDAATQSAFENSVENAGHLVAIPAAVINPYLIDVPFVALQARRNHIQPTVAPRIQSGNKPVDGGHYLFSTSEKQAFLALEPSAAPYFRRWLGAKEFINGLDRWCLWLDATPPAQLRRMPECLKRVQAVKVFRAASRKVATQKLAITPTRFEIQTSPQNNYAIIPQVSSERREYIPIGFEDAATFPSNLLNIIPNATPYHFGVITSRMHMAWTRTVCGRLKSDYRYSVGIVYNNYPWPDPDAKQAAAIEAAAQGVLTTRAMHPTASLADLYDPLAMPADLRKAHDTLDRTVDAAYGYKGPPDDASRTAFLFKLHVKLAPITAVSTGQTGQVPGNPVNSRNGAPSSMLRPISVSKSNTVSRSSKGTVLNGISVAEAYTQVRNWCQANISKPGAREDDYGNRAVRLVQALPPADDLSELEQLAVLKEVFWGLLEWAYHDDDGSFKMIDYATAAFATACKDRFTALTEEEVAQLKSGPLGHLLS